MTAAEAEALLSLRETYPLLDGWRERGRRVERPEPGSDLAGDESAWRWHDPAEVSRQSLMSATQHLNLARVAIEAGELFPTAHYTVLRGGLVGASLAVWVLGPDMPTERQQRALRVVHESYTKALQHHDEVRKVVDPSHPDAADWLDAGAHLRQRRDQTRALWTSATLLSAKQPMQTTAVIGQVADELFDGMTAFEVKRLWQQMSGDAHSLMWAVVGRSTLTRHVGGGMAEMAAGGDLTAVADAFGKIFKITRRGWSLFDRRCEGKV